MLLAALKFDSHEAFVKMFRIYYVDLVMFAGTIIPEKATCEDIVQNVFTKIWTERKELDIRTSLKSYLLKGVQNFCLDELRRRNVRLRYETESRRHILALSPEEYYLYSELRDEINNAITSLSPNERETFFLSRFEHLKYKEIADRLGVSVRTVETRISKALKLIKASIGDFTMLIAVIIYKLFI